MTSIIQREGSYETQIKTKATRQADCQLATMHQHDRTQHGAHSCRSSNWIGEYSPACDFARPEALLLSELGIGMATDSNPDAAEEEQDHVITAGKSTPSNAEQPATPSDLREPELFYELETDEPDGLLRKVDNTLMRDGVRADVARTAAQAELEEEEEEDDSIEIPLVNDLKDEHALPEMAGFAFQKQIVGRAQPKNLASSSNAYYNGAGELDVR